jgi:hypothetical protein
MSGRARAAFAVLVLAPAIVLWSSCARTRDDGATAERLLRDATLAGGYLARAVQPDGRFIYEYDPTTDSTGGGYNMLRHAGSIYAMAELYEVAPDTALRAAAARALGYMTAQVAGRDSVAALLDDGSVKLGGNALAILAITRWARATGDTGALPLAARLARWISATQEEDGAFAIHKQDWATGVIDTFRSAYYPGEAAYALAVLGERTGQASLVVAGRRAAFEAVRRQADDGEITTGEHDHWLLYALGALHAIVPDTAYVRAARPFVVSIMDAQHPPRPKRWPKSWAGGWYSPPGTTPTSVRCEGLAAVWPMFAEHDRALARRIERSLALGSDFVARHTIDVPRARAMRDSAQAIGGVMESPQDATVRIDYVQHAASAWLGYRRVLLAEDGATP